jgi:hypothetical protein
MFLARALWSQELEMKMKRDLRLNEENWVALAACATLAVSVLMPGANPAEQPGHRVARQIFNPLPNRG